ncbi:TlpA family protein disulfide reductase [Pedobacter sp. JCM 36344]|uniref:TlpA family protein disulfide reductase n=1 Tax=Pedobacter sp. JCM 36344 TaxID=3374280 RepID=UPI00397CBE84
MKNASRLIICILIPLFLTSCDKESVLTIKATGFDYNAVVSVYPSTNSAKAILVKSLKSEPQIYKVRLKKSSYGRLELSSKGNLSFWIYLDEGAQEVEFDANNSSKYPVISSSSKQGMEIISYYKLEAHMLKALNDSMRVAKEMLNNSTPETVTQAANNYNRWTELKGEQHYNIVKEFAKGNPASLFTLMMIEEDGFLGKHGKGYLELINNLSNEVKDSKEGKNLIFEITKASSRELGAKMSDVSGTNPSGKPFDPKILKKVNLFICWLSYDNDCRVNNAKLVSLYEQYKNRDVEFIGISLDKHKKWWTTVIKDDKLIWPQYSDLLHAKSPNLGSLSTQRLPYMFLTDQSGIILSQDLGIDAIAMDLETYLKPGPLPPL